MLAVQIQFRNFSKANREVKSSAARIVSVAFVLTLKFGLLRFRFSNCHLIALIR